MVVMYVRGQKVGSLTSIDELARLLETGEAFEFRSDAGKAFGRFVPTGPICPWEPELTEEEIDRRCSRPGRPLGEILKRLGAE